MEDLYWTTREGKKLLISEMTDDHIKNVLALCYKQSPQSYKIVHIISTFEKEQKRRLPSVMVPISTFKELDID